MEDTAAESITVLVVLDEGLGTAASGGALRPGFDSPPRRCSKVPSNLGRYRGFHCKNFAIEIKQDGMGQSTRAKILPYKIYDFIFLMKNLLLFHCDNFLRQNFRNTSSFLIHIIHIAEFFFQ